MSKPAVRIRSPAPALTNMASYREAAKRVRELIEFDSLAIKKLRAVEPSFKKMTVETFDSSGVTFSNDKIQALFTRFVRK